MEKVVGSVTVDGIELGYFSEGRGIPCLVVGDALPVATALSAGLREHFQFFFLTSRLNTLSAGTVRVDQITMDTLIDDIEAARDQLGLDQDRGRAAIPIQNLGGYRTAAVSQDVVEPEATVLLDDADVLGHGVALSLVRLSHQVADEHLAGVALADRLVYLLDEQCRN